MPSPQQDNQAAPFWVQRKRRRKKVQMDSVTVVISKSTPSDEEVVRCESILARLVVAVKKGEENGTKPVKGEENNKVCARSWVATPKSPAGKEARFRTCSGRVRVYVPRQETKATRCGGHFPPISIPAACLEGEAVRSLSS